ncbi:MAG TPA: tetratricopeptide repeat protein [Gemmatimonadaceae bacterium]|nr:tetratricopeptide repeat protein [Gemmatimonadaceae bacterium]
MKSLLFLIALLGCSLPAPAVTAQPSPVGPTGSSTRWADSAAREIDAASVVGDILRLRRTQTMLDQALVAFPGDPMLLHYEGYALYRIAGILQGRPKAAAPDLPLVLETARTKLEQSLAARPMAETHALLASVLGQLIGADPSTASTYGPHVTSEMNAATTMGPSNPRVWLLKGIQSIYTPAQYGGGLAIAEGQLKKAVQLFVTDAPASPNPAWGKAEAYVWLGQALQKQNRITEARAAYQQALAIQPNYPWVTYSLLPALGHK